MLAGLVDYMYCLLGLIVSVALVLTHSGAPTQYTIGSTRTRPAFRGADVVVKRRMLAH